jgi:hypothetical protein
LSQAKLDPDVPAPGAPASSTVTRAPRWASLKAMFAPTLPAPTMTISLLTGSLLR